jgi:hypothetical protein
MDDVTGIDASRLTPSSSSEFIEELNSLVRPIVWPWVLAATLLVAIFTASFQWVPLIALVTGMTVTITLAAIRNRHRVNLDYQVEGAISDWHARMRSCWPEVRNVGAVWRVASQGTTQTLYHRKVNAGAGYIVGRHRLAVAESPHSKVTSNIGLPTFIGGKQSISFLPDHILVRAGSSWSDLDYSDLRVTFHQQRFIEDGGVPRDSARVGTTWQYVNKNGGPDRRFNNNRQLPILLYGEVELSTTTGLRWMLQLSNPETGARVAAVLQDHPH